MIKPDVQADIDRLKTALVTHFRIATPFGEFSLRTYKAYDGRNPRTGDIVHVPAKRLPFLIVAPTFFRDAIGEEPRAPKPLIDEDEEELLEDDPRPPPIAIECVALYADVLAVFEKKNKARYSGFGNFERKKKALTFEASQVWKQELNPQRG